MGWFLADGDADTREQENANIQYISNVVFKYLWQNMQWKQDILHLSKLYSKNYRTKQ